MNTIYRGYPHKCLKRHVFLPGQFKHGIIYVGSPSQRQAAGLIPENLAGLSEIQKKKIMKNVDVATLSTGYDADVIEAVAEGVIFNSLEYLCKTHVNRLLVLRPRISSSGLAHVLRTAFGFLDCPYDFEFDFNNASHQCCTELIYRALHNRGHIQFSLTKRMGNQTLSADDIIVHHLKIKPKYFDFVVYAEEKPDSDSNQAMLYKGSAGERKLVVLMKETLEE